MTMVTETIVTAEEHDEIMTVHRQWIEEKCPFDKVLGLTVTSLSLESACLTFDMEDHLIGNVDIQVLHGGAIATVLDAVGSAVLTYNILSKLGDSSIAERVRHLKGVPTVDLRVDYLSPGFGRSFTAMAWILRTGGKVAVTRMELHSEDNQLIATGTGTYLIQVR